MSDPRRLIVAMGLIMGLSSAAGLWVARNPEGLLAPIVLPGMALQDHLEDNSSFWTVCDIYAGLVIAASILAWVRNNKALTYPLFAVVTFGAVGGVLACIPK